MIAADNTDAGAERLALCSRASELGQLPGWIELLASRHAIPRRAQFAIDVCLEEVLVNIIRHGYAGSPDQPIIVRFAHPREDCFEFVVEDEAPPFNPLDAPEVPAPASLQDVRVGGLGIRLLRRFADSLEYQATPRGNRLILGFSASDSASTRG